MARQVIARTRSTVIPTLPLSYDDSLSYLEKLMKLQQKVNELIDGFNGIESEWEQYTDEQIAILKQWSIEELEKLNVSLLDEILRVQNLMQNQVDLIYEDVARFKIEVQSQLNDMNIHINQMFNDIINLIDLKQIDTLNIVKVMFAEFLVIVSDMLENGFKVDNKVTYRKETVNKTLNDYYPFIMSTNDGITCGELSKLKYSCEKIRLRLISSADFAIVGYSKLIGRIREIFSPFTMQLDSVFNVTQNLAALHYQSWTISELAAFNLSVSAIADLEISCHNMAWDNTNYIY